MTGRWSLRLPPINGLIISCQAHGHSPQQGWGREYVVDLVHDGSSSRVSECGNELPVGLTEALDESEVEMWIVRVSTMQRGV